MKYKLREHDGNSIVECHTAEGEVTLTVTFTGKDQDIRALEYTEWANGIDNLAKAEVINIDQLQPAG